MPLLLPLHAVRHAGPNASKVAASAQAGRFGEGSGSSTAQAQAQGTSLVAGAVSSLRRLMLNNQDDSDIVQVCAARFLSHHHPRTQTTS